MIIIGQIESFFKNPSLEPSQSGDCILFHLRRDLEKLYGAEHNYSDDTPPHAILSMMGMLSGIDYLSKAYSIKQGSRKKFVETVRELCKIKEESSQALYQFRCALMHSVAFSTISACEHRRGDRFIFEIADDISNPFIEKLSDYGNEVTYRICFWHLKKSFIKMIKGLEKIARDVAHGKNHHLINMIGQMHSEKILKEK